MKVTGVTVTYERKVSDGQYGNEGYSVTLSAEVVDGDLSIKAAEELAIEARGVVTYRLKNSDNEHIQHAMETKQEQEERRQREHAEWEVGEATRRAEREERDRIWREQEDARSHEVSASHDVDDEDEESEENDDGPEQIDLDDTPF